MPIELRWLRSFVAVADEMHFSRAARRLRLAQPALTAQIRQLEGEIGSPLFERTNRMRGLTIAGRALLPEARALVERFRFFAQGGQASFSGGTRSFATRRHSTGGDHNHGAIPAPIY
jgi:DNA-binding transcriptional LysR family regulator